LTTGGKRNKGQATRPISTGQLNILLCLHLPAYRVVVYHGPSGDCSREISSCGGFPLRCLQRLSRPDIATRHCHWHDNRNTRVRHPGPLVLRTAHANLLRLQQIGTELVSRRSEPNSRTALIGEQPNPWDLLSQDAMSRHRGAKPRRRYELLDAISLLSRRTFYPLSDGPSMRCHRITKPYFRICSTCWSHS